MKKVISLLGMILLCCGISYATKVSITDNWKFTPSDSENFASSGLDDSKWQTVSIPHTWNDKDIIAAGISTGSFMVSEASEYSFGNERPENCIIV